MTKIVDNIVGLRDMTTEEQAQYDKDSADWNSKSNDRKLSQIRLYRNRKLEQTDYLAMSDNVLTDEMKAFRKSMRDIPQDYSADKYDELLARDDNGELTHTVWSKP